LKLRQCVWQSVAFAWYNILRCNRTVKVSRTMCGLDPRPMVRLIGLPLPDFSLPRLNFLVLFQYLGRQWTAEELAMGTELQGLGPGDVEAE
jgi:hypothetical protein